MNLFRSIAIALAIALAVSVAGNYWLAEGWQSERDAHLLAAAARDQAQGAAHACSAGVERMELEARQRKQAADRAIAAAQAAARGHQAAAQRLLSAPPAVPGDDCRSAEAAIDGWLQGRARK